ncbi:unnamed protein product [Ixodes hexagonus]
MTATLQLVTERLATGTGGTGGHVQQRGPDLHPRLTVPVYTGFDDRKSVADFLEELDFYARASGASESYVLERILPHALQASARRWWVLQTPFPSLEAFRRSFREEFLPPGYDSKSSESSNGVPNTQKKASLSTSGPCRNCSTERRKLLPSRRGLHASSDRATPVTTSTFRGGGSTAWKTSFVRRAACKR